MGNKVFVVLSFISEPLETALWSNNQVLLHSISGP